MTKAQGDIGIVARDSTVYHTRDREVVAARRLSFGASQLEGLSIIVDQFGYLWISTSDGLGFIHRDDFATVKSFATPPRMAWPA